MTCRKCQIISPSGIKLRQGDIMKKYVAEFIGAAALVLLGCGTAVIGAFGADWPMGIMPVALAFGLAVTAMAYGIGPISGCHINPAVTIAAWTAGRMETREVPGYIIAQVLGAIAGAGLLLLILQGKIGGYDLAKGGLGQNGWGPGYLGGYGMTAAFIVEVVGTFLFTLVILGVTSKAGAPLVAGLAIGLTLTVVHLTFINVTGVSVNPARSIGPAVFVGGNAMSQVWLFILAPLIGGALAGLLFRNKILED
ncbi:MAG: aquaporin [Bosea sp. (in: a-proteobacteria)]